MQFDKIKFLDGVSSIFEVNEGYSGAKKYRFNKGKVEYFLKIGPFKIIDNLESLLTQCHIVHSKIVDYGVYDEYNNYIILKFLKGKNLKYILDEKDKKFIYEFGFQMGEQYRNLKNKFEVRSISEKEAKSFYLECQNRIKDLESELEFNQENIALEDREFIEFFKKYLIDNFELFRKSISIFAHTDVKPSNFMIVNKKIVAIDIENTGYKEVARALEWSYARSDYCDEKNWAFGRGYLDGIFNLDVPECVLKSCNYIYAFNKVKYLRDLLAQHKYDDIKKFKLYFLENIFKDGNITIDEKLKSPYNLENLGLIDYVVTMVKGSYCEANLTFKCSKRKKHYFLKIMNISEKTLFLKNNEYK